MFAKCRIEIKASACWLDPRWLVTVTDRTWSKLTDDRSFSYPSSFSLLRNTTQKLLLLLRMSHCGHKTASQLFNPPGLVLFFFVFISPKLKVLEIVKRTFANTTPSTIKLKPCQILSKLASEWTKTKTEATEEKPIHPRWSDRADWYIRLVSVHRFYKKDCQRLGDFYETTKCIACCSFFRWGQ